MQLLVSSNDVKDILLIFVLKAAVNTSNYLWINDVYTIINVLEPYLGHKIMFELGPNIVLRFWILYFIIAIGICFKEYCSFFKNKSILSNYQFALILSEKQSIWRECFIANAQISK